MNDSAEHSEASYDFDPSLDFSQFLEEARKHSTGVDVPATLSYSRSVAKEKRRQEKKSKLSWKSSLLSWWRADRKGKLQAEEESTKSSSYSYFSTAARRRGCSSSGPIIGSKGQAERRLRRPTSGPLAAGLFNPSMRRQKDMPYMQLNRLKRHNSHGSQAYGPVYLVT